MKDTVDRRAALGALARRSARSTLARDIHVPSADPIFTAVALDRVAFAAFVNRTDKGKAAQEGREVTQADEDAYEAASGVEEDAVSETEG